MKLVLLGDVGGQGTAFLKTLETLNVDLATFAMPNDLTILQLGDLIHKGPDSDLLVHTVNELMNRNGDQWVQLLGNHESQHTYGVHFWRCDCSSETIQTLNNWRVRDEVAVAAHFNIKPHKYFETSQLLVTHAGVTRNFFKNSPAETLPEFVEWVNANMNEEVVQTSGVMLQQSMFRREPRPNYSAGPIWAHSLKEVYESWFECDMPFDQVHGHTSPFNFQRKEWWINTPRIWRERIKVYQEGKAESFYPTETGGNFVGIDPCFSTKSVIGTAMPYLELELL